MRTILKHIKHLLIVAVLISATQRVHAHKVEFCGEALPVDNDFVANKLMNVIRKQIPNVNLPSLRQRARQYFPIVEAYLKKHNLPDDLKYLAIVESGFVSNAQSHVGARGFWQIMPKTAQQYGLSIADPDERDDIHKSTSVACRLLIDNYNYIKKKHNVQSWSLACAAYNFGIGNITKAVTVQGSNYYTMELNPETSVYVYKIVAVKELFEYPELYIGKLGYNVFSANASAKNHSSYYGDDNDDDFKKAKLTKHHKPAKTSDTTYYISAHIKPQKDFKEGDFVQVTFDEDLITNRGVQYKGSSLSPKGWIIDDRVVLDIGYGHDVILYDLNLVKGVPLEQVKAKGKKGVPVLLKVTRPI